MIFKNKSWFTFNSYVMICQVYFGETVNVDFVFTNKKGCHKASFFIESTRRESNLRKVKAAALASNPSKAKKIDLFHRCRSWNTSIKYSCALPP